MGAEGLHQLSPHGVPSACRSQDKFDHDKGQKSASSGRGSPLEALHWIFCFFSSIYVQFSKTNPTNPEKVAKNPLEKIVSNPVTSVAVMVFSALKELILGKQ